MLANAVMGIVAHCSEGHVAMDRGPSTIHVPPSTNTSNQWLLTLLNIPSSINL